MNLIVDLTICRIIQVKTGILEDRLKLISSQMKEFTGTEILFGHKGYKALVKQYDKTVNNIRRYTIVYNRAKERIQKRMY